MIAPSERVETLQVTFHGLVEGRSAAHPDYKAVRTRERELTYGELNNLANALARQIHRLAVPRSFIAVVLGDGLESVVAMLAISKAGCVRVPIDSRQPAAGAEAILRQVEISAFVTDQANIEMVRALDKGKPIIVVTPVADGIPSADNLDLEIGTEDPFLLAFTSGSSGVPKGMLNSHKDLTTHNLHALQAHFGSDDRVLRFGAMSSSGGSSSIRRVLIAGGVVDILDLSREMPETIFQWIIDRRVTVIAITSTLFRAIFSTPPKMPITTVRMLRLGTEPVLEVDFQLFKRCFAPGTLFVNTYGTTEVGHITGYSADHSTHFDGAMVPVGKPSHDVQVMIVDENRTPLQAGETGEIIVRTRQKQASYWNSPEQSEGKFYRDPDDPEFHFYRTGDLGRFLPDGNLVHLGRSDSMVKIRGFRVELAAIENALRQHPDIESAVVKPVSDSSAIRIVAYVVAHVGITLSIPQLRSFLSETLADFMIPAQFMVMEHLPTLPSGKVNLPALPVPQAETGQGDPLTLTESRLYPVFRNVLPTAVIGRNDNFFDIGGDSLMAMRLVSDLKSQFGLTLTPALVYSHPTLAELAAYVDQGSPTLSPLIALNPYGTQPVIIGVPGARGNAMLFRELAGELGHDYPLYAFQFPAYDENAPKFDTMQAFARCCIDLISSTVNAERFYLIGASVGGIIAFEMAQQLTAMGRPPLGLIMVDTHFNRSSRDVYHFEDDAPPAVIAPSKVISPMQRVRKFVYKWRNKGMNFFFPSQETRAIKRVKRQTKRITRSYVAQPYAGRLIYLTCREDRKLQGEQEMNYHRWWEKLAKGGFELLDTPGGHAVALAQPFARDVARQMRRILSDGEKN